MVGEFLCLEEFTDRPHGSGDSGIKRLACQVQRGEKVSLKEHFEVGPPIVCDYCGMCPCIYEVAPEAKPEVRSGFTVVIHDHSLELSKKHTPESLRFAIGEMLDKRGYQEEVDYTLEVNRTYEQR
jgi:hypothetical protein